MSRLLVFVIPVLLLIAVAKTGSAQTFNFTTGTQSWNVDGNWTPSGFPNAVGASATFNSPTGAQTVNLGAAITVGSISFTNNTASIFTLANGTGGSITFDQTGSSNAQLNVSGTSATTNNFTLSGSVTLNDSLDLNINNTAATGSAAATFTGAVTGSGGLTKNGDGSFTLSSAAKTYTGATVVNGGILRFTATGTATGTSAITVNSGGQLRLDTNNGAFSFGSATITLNGAGSTGALASQGALRNQGSGVNTLSNSVNVASNSAIHVNNSGNSLQLNGNLSGAGLVTKTGGGTLIINGSSNTHTGGFSVTNGTVTATASTSIGGPLTLAQALGNNTTFNINSSQTISSLATTWTDLTGTFAQTLNLNGAGTKLTINQATDTTFGNGAVGTLTSVIAGVGGLAKSGAGKLTLASANTYSGGTSIDGGTLIVANSAALGSTGTISFGGGSLQYSGVNTDFSSRFSSAAGQAFSVDTNGSNVSYGTAVTSAGGSLTKSGAGVLSLSGAGSSVSSVNVLAGTLEIGSVANLNASLVTVSSGATLDVDGTLTSSSGVNVNNGATLMGAGTIAGDLNVAGSVNPGNSPGTLTVNGDMALTGNSTLNFELSETNQTAGGGINDLIVVNGNLTLDGTLNIPDPSTPLSWTTNGTFANPISWTLFTFTGSLTDNGLTLGNLPTLSGTPAPQSWKLNIVFNPGSGGSVNLTAVPEPSAALVLGSVIVGAAVRKRNRRVS